MLEKIETQNLLEVFFIFQLVRVLLRLSISHMATFFYKKLYLHKLPSQKIIFHKILKFYIYQAILFFKISIDFLYSLTIYII